MGNNDYIPVIHGIRVFENQFLPVEETVEAYDIITREKVNILTGNMIDAIKIGRDILTVSPLIYQKIKDELCDKES